MLTSACRGEEKTLLMF